jgi:hypothetical protein
MNRVKPIAEQVEVTRSMLLKKPHMLRCPRPIRFNVLKRTPQLIERRAPRL